MRRDVNLHFPDQPNCNSLPSRKEPYNHVALLADWDTPYGRDLSVTVAKTFNGKKEIDPKSIRRVSYLRGLDGRLPGRNYVSSATASHNDAGEQKSSEPVAASPQGAAATPETADRFESAEGQSQFDYLRRLAADLKKEDAELRRKDGRHIGAIGILGSDAYDKLLILQALRPEFPGALFFTTDLDALLLPQEKSHYTRNLLVASSYGLRLRCDVQADIPPFRNTYQSSLFVATTLALQNEWPNPTSDPKAVGAKPDCWPRQPVLFQIGRSAVWDLSSGSEDAAASESGKKHCSRPEMINYTMVQPKAAELYPAIGGRALGGIGVLVAGLLLAGVFTSHAVRSYCFPRSEAPDQAAQTRLIAVRPRLDTLLLLFLVAAVIATGFYFAWPKIGPFLTRAGSASR